MPQLQFVIQFDPSTGELGLAGSPEVMGNQVLAFGLLETAKHAIVAQAAKAERRIQPATFMPPEFPGAK